MVIYQGKLYNLAAFLLQTLNNSDTVVFNDQAASSATSLTHQGIFAKYAVSVSSKVAYAYPNSSKHASFQGF